MRDTTTPDSGNAPEPDASVDEAVIERYVIGDHSAADAAVVERWMSRAPADAAVVRWLRARLTSFVYERPNINLAAARAEFARRTAMGTRESSYVALTAPRGAGHGSWVGAPRFTRRAIATTAVGVFTIAFAVWITGMATLPGFEGRARTTLASVATREIVVPNGRRATVTLDDGTRVVLNAGSRLRVPRDLRGSRTVSLDGEALFTVTHRDAIPFVVRSGPALVTVLGTEFAVRRYPGDSRARVAVLDGRVSLVRAGTGVAPSAVRVLGARTLAEVTDSGETIVMPNGDTDRPTAWARGELVFRETPLRDVLPELERRYGLVIRLSDTTLAARRLTATVTDDAAASVLDGIALTLGVRYVRDGNTVTFFPRRAEAPRTRLVPLPPATEPLHGK